MIFEETTLKGSFVIVPENIVDIRGFFARIFCGREFTERGLNPDFVQGNISFNHKAGTLRGMHYQIPPHEEVKLVRCTVGAIYDVIIDLRAESPTFMKWFAVELTAENRKQLYVPKGFGHGYQTMEDRTEVSYQVSSFYTPSSERGIRWNDPAFGIVWPLSVSLISEKDAAHPDWEALR